jgi:hypothetical protein
MQQELSTLCITSTVHTVHTVESTQYPYLAFNYACRINPQSTAQTHPSGHFPHPEIFSHRSKY